MFTWILITAGVVTVQAQIGAVSSVRRNVDYSIRNNSFDKAGDKYIMNWSSVSSVLTFVNRDGSITVCTSDDKDGTTYVYEYTGSLQEQKTLSFKNEFGSLGAFTKDDGGSYYFFYGMSTANKDAENMAMVKYGSNGKKMKTYRLTANAPSSFSGIQVPFDAGTCRLELSGSMLAVYFARKMFNGHQASYGFVLDKDSFERIDKGAATNANIEPQKPIVNTPLLTVKDGNNPNMQMPYTSHSFNQFILPIDGGFLFADHGDAYPRSFTFAKFIKGSDTRRIHAFTFPGKTGDNVTHAEMGALAKTSTGYIFAGVYGEVKNNPRNLFVLTVDENLTKCSAPVYLTKYTKENGHAGLPKIVSTGHGQYVVLWEFFKFPTPPTLSFAGHSINISSQPVDGNATDYMSTFALAINEKGKSVSDVKEMKGTRLNLNDVLRYNSHNGKIYWAINNSGRSFTLYALETQSGGNTKQQAAASVVTTQKQDDKPTTASTVTTQKQDNKQATASVVTTQKQDNKQATASVVTTQTRNDKPTSTTGVKTQGSANAKDASQASFKLKRGDAAFNTKNYDRAIAEYGEVIKLDPNYAAAYNGRGAAYAEKKDYARAIADFESVLRIDPGHSGARKAIEELQGKK